ncbi:xylulokinase [Microbacterium sp. AG1240]|uniref:FGGY-family carbohydrate kinase n=1 Tax=Microbacterium sp. AG1240 TaxID=2183992 RepID=UPI000EB2C489|nr:FGGY family carbohydrate kinase [Microbacterium sp. AG1240]RKT36016.1 xylulokinase [Microbacterium sp. AG1240]
MSASSRVPVACGVDVGSTNSKVVAIDPSGAVVARASRPTPRDAVDLSVKVDRLFDAVEEMVVEVCGEIFEVHAICVAGVGEDGVLVDERLRVLTPALTWFDPRRQDLFRALRPQLVDDETFDSETDPVRTVVGWAWARAHETAGRARSWLALTDLAACRWAARPFFSDTLASRTAAWRSSDRVWAFDRVTATLGSPELLPPVVATGEIVGALESTTLRAAGVIAADAITVAGGHDHPIAGWGVQQIVPGAILDSMGTAEVVVAQVPGLPVARGEHVDVAPGIRSDGRTLLRVEELARNVQWASQDADVAAHVRALLEGAAEPLPLWDSGYFVPGERGGGAPSYSSDAPRDPRARASAVLGALAVAGRDAVDAVSAGMPGRAEVRLAGGWVRSPGWIEIKSAVHRLRAAPILEPEVTAVGAALLAATARGWRPDAVVSLGGFTASMLG